MITAMLVSMVVLSLGLVTIQLSSHSSTASAFDRKRVQAVHAAEAGLDAYLALLPRTEPFAIQCTPGVTDIPISPGAQFQVTATFYPTFPGQAGEELSCPLSASDPPQGAVIVSRGTAVAVANSRAVSRTMQTEVRLNPLRGGFGHAIFSHTGLSVQNNLTVQGNVGNDGDLYTNGNFVCQNSSVDYGTVITHGSATLSNSCTVLQDLHAVGNITMGNTSRIGHDATSSTGSITLTQSARIDNNARAAGTCTGCDPGHVRGTVTTGSASPLPERIELPTVNFVADAWIDEGYDVREFSSCDTGLNNAKQFVLDVSSGARPAGDYVVRINANCALTFATSDPDINVRGNLAIVTNGSIALENFNRWTGIGTARDLHWIVPRDLFTPATPPDSAATNCSGQDISVGNNTDFTNLRTFWYTPCTSTFDNNNIGLGGQIISGTVNLRNQMSFAFRPIDVPGAGAITGFTPDIAYIREIAA